MSFLQCQNCGRVIYSDYNIEVGLPCKVRGCNGIMEFQGGHYYVYPSKEAKLDLQCRECFHICSSKISGLSVGSPCPICRASMDRYYH